MKKVLIVTTEVLDNKTFYSMEARGTRYTLSKNDDGWELISKRLALSRFSTPSFSFFDSLKEIENSLKCMVGISLLLDEV